MPTTRRDPFDIANLYLNAGELLAGAVAKRLRAIRGELDALRRDLE